MKIGDPVPKWRVPALIHGELTSFTLSRIKGKRMVVCCISSIAELEILLLNNQINHFEKYETALIVLVLSKP